MIRLLPLLFLLAGCATQVTESGNYADPIGSSIVTENPTIYSESLDCLGEAYRSRGLQSIYAVGYISDSTNTRTVTEGGSITEGASLMLISALSKAGLSQVERFDMRIAQDEVGFARDQLLGHPRDDEFKKLLAGSIRSADYYIVGGISELNFNIRSNVGELKIPEVGIGGRYAVINIALDLRLVETESLVIKRVVSMQKQIIGREFRAGFFDFLGSRFTVGLFNDKSAEPIQLGVRTVIERALIDLVSPLYEVDPSQCLSFASTRINIHTTGAKSRNYL
jgi:curli biogenesis system outer membrane secretion channel CsgG